MRSVYTLVFSDGRAFATTGAASFRHAIDLAERAGYDPSTICRGERTTSGDLGTTGLAEEIERFEKTEG